MRRIDRLGRCADPATVGLLWCRVQHWKQEKKIGGTHDVGKLSPIHAHTSAPVLTPGSSG